jgi:hypothetical protein
MMKKLILAALAACLLAVGFANAQQIQPPVQPPTPDQRVGQEWHSVDLASQQLTVSFQHLIEATNAEAQALQDQAKALAQSKAESDYWKAACDKTPGCSKHVQ